MLCQRRKSRDLNSLTCTIQFLGNVNETKMLQRLSNIGIGKQLFIANLLQVSQDPMVQTNSQNKETVSVVRLTSQIYDVGFLDLFV